MPGRRDDPPTLAEARAVLDLFVTVSAPDPWGEILAEQVRSLERVSGTLWYADLTIQGNPARLPPGTPVPIARILASKRGSTPIGSLILWVGDESGWIDCIEYAAVDQSAVERYPRPEELEELR